MSSSSAVSSAAQPAAFCFDPRDLECSICLKTMDKVTTLVCGHNFGEQCIKRWLQQQGPGAGCPMCKANRIILPSPEILAKVQDRRIALQAACDAEPSVERCTAALIVEEAPEDPPEPMCQKVVTALLMAVLVAGVIFGAEGID